MKPLSPVYASLISCFPWLFTTSEILGQAMIGIVQGKNKKIILITGATNGIGRAATIEFERRGASPILIGRDKEKIENTINEIRRITGNFKLDYVLCDLTHLADVRSCSRRL
ncbi:SDR family NAD(P)-dependent oxidoreductase [Acinetobacter nectaris]|uniref:SDR family NAD(P)-dependent oxidoreductase n=1 Tax=Acinetobacter nectaris TaxID=1219382 RepID=UPI002351B52B|nr:SDR family NAD(P)-dependent oxidoreductase [Acinetobacter nectaris]MCF9046955.1 SDR family NAD(P)-dependent oxidoreductase [Acinetobacter nectaris]